jgi:hypothetical protein
VDAGREHDALTSIGLRGDRRGLRRANPAGGAIERTATVGTGGEELDAYAAAE